MTICKDCLHYDVCASNEYVFSQFTGEIFERLIYIGNRIDCKRFKDKSRYIELPCNVGDTVYVITTCDNVIVDKDWETGATECPFEDIYNCNECCDNNEMIFPTIISSIYNDGNGWLFELRNLVFSCDIDDFGTAVFLTREEAEKALKESEQE